LDPAKGGPVPGNANSTLSRRALLRLLAAAGVTEPAAVRLAAQARKQVSIDALRDASSLLDKDFDDARLKVVQIVLQRNLDQFQIVRDLEIDDLIEPSITFDPTRH
jgi:DNA-binding FadR family transcriptional regulator